MNILTVLILITIYNSIASLFIKNQNLLYCGIVGYSGAENFIADKIKVLLTFNVSRGEEGTGMWNNGKITKSKEKVYDFLSKNEIIPEKTFIGHARQSSTYAYKEDRHAHPFQFGTIIGCHNGTLKGIDTLSKKYGIKGLEYDIDSEVLINTLEKTKEDKFKSLKDIDGAASVLWTDTSEEGVIYCFRKNDERPLFRGYINNNMYISSMDDSLKVIGCEKITSFKIKTIYKIKDGIILSTAFLADTKKEEKHPATVPFHYRRSIEEDQVNDYGAYDCGNYMNDHKSESRTIKDLFSGVKTSIVGFKSDHTPHWAKLKTNLFVYLDRQTATNSFVAYSNLKDASIKSDKSITVYETEIKEHLYPKAGGYGIITGDEARACKKGSLIHIRSVHQKTNEIGTIRYESIPFDGAVYELLYPGIRAATDEEIISGITDLYDKKILVDAQVLVVDSIVEKTNKDLDKIPRLNDSCLVCGGQGLVTDTSTGSTDEKCEFCQGSGEEDASKMSEKDVENYLNEVSMQLLEADPTKEDLIDLIQIGIRAMLKTNNAIPLLLSKLNTFKVSSLDKEDDAAWSNLLHSFKEYILDIRTLEETFKEEILLATEV